MNMTKNRQTKTEIEQYDGVGLYCVDHNRSCEFSTKTEARSFASVPAQWCEECATIVSGG